MKWTLFAVAAVLLLSFPQLAGIATHPIALALGAGVIADATTRRARTRRGRR